eukprot:gene7240-14772_t
MNTPGHFAKFEKCQCCNNPWNQVAIEGNIGAVACSTCLSDTKGYTAIDSSNFDNSVLPTDNFYLWSNGGWKQNNPIPGEYSSWNTFIALRDMNLDRLKVILEDLESGKVELNPENEKISSFYFTMMNESKIEELGASALAKIISFCNNAKNDPITTLATLHSEYGINALFSMYSSPDKKDSDHSICTLTQSGLGLPDRDYYFDADKKDKRELYLEYITKVFCMLGTNGYEEFKDVNVCKDIAMQVLEFETNLASSHLTRTLSRDPELTYNKKSINELNELCSPESTWASYLAYGITEKRKPNLDWNKYFELIGKPTTTLGDINVTAIEAIKKVSSLLHSKILKYYFIFHVVNNMAPHLSSEFVTEHFNLFEKALKGTVEQRPRWKRALEALESALGEALGKIYVTRHFPSNAKAEALRIVELVRDALRTRLTEVQWMCDETRVEAMKKMEKFKVKIGYPAIITSDSSHVDNVFRARKFLFELELSRMNVPTDR